MKEIIGIIGAGAYGSALAHAFAAAGRKTILWARDKKIVAEINENQSNSKYMEGHVFKNNMVSATDNFDQLIDLSNLLIYCCPSSNFLKILETIKMHPKFEQIDFINTSKGIDLKDNILFDQCVKNLLGRKYWKDHYAVLSGPSFASEILTGQPTCLSLASKKRSSLKRIQNMIGTRFFRVYGSADLTAVQLGGAVKNVIAIACGVAEGLGFGMNTKAAIINLGLGEMTRLGRKMGAKALTFRGFSGLGDLVLTCTGPQSRNQRFGLYLGQGLSPKQSLEKINSTVEGINTSQAVHFLSKKYSLELPICEEAYNIIHKEKDLQHGIDDLLSRPQLEEWRW